MYAFKAMHDRKNNRLLKLHIIDFFYKNLPRRFIEILNMMGLIQLISVRTVPMNTNFWQLTELK